MPIKDAISIAISLVAISLSLIGFRRTLRLERKVFLEGHFKLVWISISDALSNQITDINRWLSLDTDDQLDGRQIYAKECVTLPSTAAEYDPNIASQLACYSNVIVSLRNEITAYDLLHDATSDWLSTSIRIQDPSEEPDGLFKKRLDNAAKVAAKYCPGLKRPTFGDLKNNRRYKRDLRKRKTAIKRLTSRLRNVHAKISANSKIYSDKFAPSSR